MQKMRLWRKRQPIFQWWGGGKGVPRVLGGGGGRGEKERGEEGSGTDFTIEFLEENLYHVF